MKLILAELGPAVVAAQANGGDSGSGGLKIVAVIMFLGLLIISKAVTQGQPNPRKDKWESAAGELGLKSHVRSGKKAISTMRGEIEGHRVSVSCQGSRAPKIDVRFESGLRWLDIDPRRESTRRGDTGELTTGDGAFDSRYRVRNRPDLNAEEVRAWLTPERREILMILGDALAVDEIEENELEVELGTTDWTSFELVQAVQLCVLVAQTLDRSYKASPQDQIRPSAPPQDAAPQDARRDIA